MNTKKALSEALRDVDRASPLTRPRKARGRLLDGLLWAASLVLLMTPMFAPAIARWLQS